MKKITIKIDVKFRALFITFGEGHKQWEFPVPETAVPFHIHWAIRGVTLEAFVQ